MDLLKLNERIDYMYNGDLHTIQKKDAFPFSLDTLLLGYPAQIKIHDNCKVVDLCSRNAAASIYMPYFNRAHYDAVEIQAGMADQASRNIKSNRLENWIEVRCLNALGAPKRLGKDKCDMVVVNPSCFKVPKGHVINSDKKKALARHELVINLGQIIKVSNDMSRMKGKVFVVHCLERLGKIMHYCLENHLSVKWVQPFASERNADTNLMIIEAVRNTTSDGLTLGDAIVVHNPDGSFTPEIEQVISENKKQEKERYYFYCLLCNDGSFYGGSINDLKHRLKMHSEGRGVKYTKARRPVKMTYHEEFADERLTLKREYWFKHHSRKWKEEFLKEHNARFQLHLKTLLVTIFEYVFCVFKFISHQEQLSS